MDRGSWWATVQEVTKNRIQLTLPLFIPFRVAQDLLFYTKRPLKVRERKRKEGRVGGRKGRKKMKKKRRKRKVEKRGVGEEKKKKKKKVISYLKDRLLVVYCDQAEILFPLHTHVFVLRPNAQK